MNDSVTICVCLCELVGSDDAISVGVQLRKGSRCCLLLCFFCGRLRCLFICFLNGICCLLYCVNCFLHLFLCLLELLLGFLHSFRVFCFLSFLLELLLGF